MDWAAPILFLGNGAQVNIEDPTGFVSGSGDHNIDKQVAANLVNQRVGNDANLSALSRLDGSKNVSFSSNVQNSNHNTSMVNS